MALLQWWSWNASEIHSYIWEVTLKLQQEHPPKKYLHNYQDHTNTLMDYDYWKPWQQVYAFTTYKV